MSYLIYFIIIGSAYGIICAMKKRIKIKFMGFAPYHKPYEQSYYRFLSERYDLLECDNPDYVIDGGQNFRHLKYDAVKILFNSENLIPDFNDYDYAIGSSELSFGDRYLRVPWFAFYPCFADIARRKTELDSTLLKREFCSFVVSNAEFGDPMRRLFFERLSKYKPVASGGKYLNNVGGPVKDKIEFCRRYKFNIAFENSSFPGYTTEKIMEAYVAQTVPIYYGNPNVSADFRLESMVRVADESDVERAVAEVVRLDQDDDAYLKMVTEPCLVEKDAGIYEERLEQFLSAIFDQPIEKSRRLCPYGQQAVMRRHMKYVRGVDQFVRDFPGYDVAVGLLGKVRVRMRG